MFRKISKISTIILTVIGAISLLFVSACAMLKYEGDVPTTINASSASKETYTAVNYPSLNLMI